MTFDIIKSKFIRGAAYSKEDEAIYLIEANHTLFKLEALPVKSAAFLQIEGSDFLAQSKIISVSCREPVAHQVTRDGKEVRFCSRQYDVLTDAGNCRLTIGSQDIECIKELSVECLSHIGYPPDDAKRLEDTND